MARENGELTIGRIGMRDEIHVKGGAEGICDMWLTMTVTIAERFGLPLEAMQEMLCIFGEDVRGRMVRADKTTIDLSGFKR